MDGPGFHVDVPVLDEAARGLVESVDDQSRSRLADVPGGAGAYGDGDLHAAFTDFCDRWSDGLDILVEDARAIGDGLRRAADAYRATDAAAAARLSGDPAAAVIDD
jgi:uncharacterized protein YukE